MAERAQEIGVRAARAVDPRTAARWAAVVIVLLGGLGIAHEAAGGFNAFDLDVEGTVPAGWSAGLDFAAGGLALLLSRLGPPATRTERRWLLALGFFLVYMGFDEGLRLHEDLDAWLNFDWQLLYAPFVLVAAFAWLVGLRVLGRLGAPTLLFVGGAAAWVLAQTIEIFQVGGHLRPGAIDSAHLTEAQFERATSTTGYVISMVSEELLEMTGSLLFVLALLAGVRALVTRRDLGADEPRVALDQQPGNGLGPEAAADLRVHSVPPR